MEPIQLKPKKILSADEQETAVIIDGASDASVYSSNPKMIEKFQQWLNDYPESISLHSDDAYGTHISIPKKWIKIKPPKQRSDEWKADAKQRLQNARAKRNREK